MNPPHKLTQPSEPSSLPAPRYTHSDPSEVSPAVMHRITLPDGRAAYIPVGEAVGDAAPASRVYQYDDGGEVREAYEGEDAVASECCGKPLTRGGVRAGRGWTMTFVVLGLSVCLVAAVFAMMEMEDLCCKTASLLMLVGGIVLLATFFFITIPSLVLAGFFVHIGRRYPLKEDAEERRRERPSLSEAQRRESFLFRVVYDVNITRALFSVLFISVFGCVSGCAVLFVGELSTFDSCQLKEGCRDDRWLNAPLSAILAGAAAVLFLLALILTPTRCATGGSLHFPDALK